MARPTPSATVCAMSLAIAIITTAGAAAGAPRGGCKTACTGFAEFDAEAMMKKHGMQLPRCCPSDGLSSEWMAAATSANKSVLDYLYPP